MDENDGKGYEKLYKPAPKGKEFDPAYDICEMMNEWDEKNADKVDWTGAAMVIQGASHHIARKIDVLHKEANEAASNLRNSEFEDVDEDDNKMIEGARSRKKKKSLLDRIAEAKDMDEFFEGEPQIDEEEEERIYKERNEKNEAAGRGQKLQPPIDPFFRDLSEEERGRPLYEVNTGEFVGYANDFWCFRADITDNGIVFPGQSPNDPDVLSLRVPYADSKEVDQAEEASVEPFEGSHHSMEDVEVNFEPAEDGPESPRINDPNETGQGVEMEIEESSIVTQSAVSGSVGEIEAISDFRLESNSSTDEQSDNDDTNFMDVFEEALKNLEVNSVEYNDNYRQSQKAERKSERRRRMQEGVGCNVLSRTARYVFSSRQKFKRIPNRTEQELEDLFGGEREVSDELFIKSYWEMWNFATYGDIRGNPKKIKEKKKQMREYRRAQKNAICFDSARIGLEKRAKEQNKTMRQVISEELGADTTPGPWQQTNEHNEEVDEVTNTMNASQVTGTGHDYDILENFDAPQYECYDDPSNDLPSGEWGPETTEGYIKLQANARAQLLRWSASYVDNHREQAVRKWKESIQPFLDLEDKRTPFDMRNTIDMLDSKMIDGEDTTLDELGPFEDNWQRVQCFAAILQMANEGKIIIKPGQFTMVRGRLREEDTVRFQKVAASKRAGVFDFEAINRETRNAVAIDDSEYDSPGESNDSKRARSNTVDSTGSIAELRPPQKKSRKLRKAKH